MRKLWHKLFGCKPDYVWRRPAGTGRPHIFMTKRSPQNIYCSVCDRWYIDDFQVLRAMAGYSWKTLNRFRAEMGNLPEVWKAVEYEPIDDNDLPIPIDEVIHD